MLNKIKSLFRKKDTLKWGNGIEVGGAFYNKDKSYLDWDTFIEKIESVGLVYGGSTVPIDENGDWLEGQDPNLDLDSVNKRLENINRYNQEKPSLKTGKELLAELRDNEK